MIHLDTAKSVESFRSHPLAPLRVLKTGLEKEPGSATESAPEFKGEVPVHSYANSGAKITRPGSTGRGQQVAPGVFVQASPGNQPDNDIDLFPGLKNEALIEAIRHQARSRKKLRYKDARRIVLTVVDRHQGALEAIYTGRFVRSKGVPKVNGKDGMNIEHIWPQSLRGPKSDMHHLVPADTEVNSRRGSHPFGVVQDVVFEEGGSKLGYDADGDMVFEPRDATKGNIARAMFYVATVYPLDIPPKEEALMRLWNDMDPVDDREAMRHERTAEKQNNRNPFVDDDDLVDRIKDL